MAKIEVNEHSGYKVGQVVYGSREVYYRIVRIERNFLDKKQSLTSEPYIWVGNQRQPKKIGVNTVITVGGYNSPFAVLGCELEPSFYVVKYADRFGKKINGKAETCFNRFYFSHASKNIEDTIKALETLAKQIVVDVANNHEKPSKRQRKNTKR